VFGHEPHSNLSGRHGLLPEELRRCGFAVREVCIARVF
jgi:hypothetical protein